MLWWLQLFFANMLCFYDSVVFTSQVEKFVSGLCQRRGLVILKTLFGECRYGETWWWTIIIDQDKKVKQYCLVPCIQLFWWNHAFFSQQWRNLCKTAADCSWKKIDTKNGITVARQAFQNNPFAVIKVGYIYLSWHISTAIVYGTIWPRLPKQLLDFGYPWDFLVQWKFGVTWLCNIHHEVTSCWLHVI